MKKLKLGILGLSEGNGHPYSWSAIFNGYNPKFMKDCPFPAIPKYLSKQKFPQDSIKEATVTHIWTQDKVTSEHIAKACYIENIVNNFENLEGKVDAILLARDDAKTHYDFCVPFLKAGLPIYIDKPLAYDVKTANKIYALEQYSGQIFTCSALAYSKEFQLNKEELNHMGEIRYVDSWVMKDWKKYGIHIIEPVLRIIGDQGEITNIKTINMGERKRVVVFWKSGLITSFLTLGNLECPISIHLFGRKDYRELVFQDTFSAFRSALQHFIGIILQRKHAPSKESVLKIIKIIEGGS